MDNVRFFGNLLYETTLNVLTLGMFSSYKNIKKMEENNEKHKLELIKLEERMNEVRTKH